MTMMCHLENFFPRGGCHDDGESDLGSRLQAIDRQSREDGTVVVAASVVPRTLCHCPHTPVGSIAPRDKIIGGKPAHITKRVARVNSSINLIPTSSYGQRTPVSVDH